MSQFNLPTSSPPLLSWVSPVLFPLIVLVRTCTQVVAVCLLAGFLALNKSIMFDDSRDVYVVFLLLCVLLWDGCICRFRHCSCCVCLCVCSKSDTCHAEEAPTSSVVMLVNSVPSVLSSRVFDSYAYASRPALSLRLPSVCHYRETKEHTHTHTTSPSPNILVCIVCGWPVMSGYIPVSERTTAVHGHS